ncbi:MAG: hypothetical protein ACR2LK_04745 [Solirubrobacteraceae bacterium]
MGLRAVPPPDDGDAYRPTGKLTTDEPAFADREDIFGGRGDTELAHALTIVANGAEPNAIGGRTGYEDARIVEFLRRHPRPQANRA